MALIGFRLVAWTTTLSSEERLFVRNIEDVCCYQEELTPQEASAGPRNYATFGEYVSWGEFENSAIYDVVEFPFCLYVKTYQEYCERTGFPTCERKFQESAMLDYLDSFSDAVRAVTRCGRQCSVARFLVYEGYDGCALRVFHCSTRLLNALAANNMEFELRPTVASEFYADLSLRSDR